MWRKPLLQLLHVLPRCYALLSYHVLPRCYALLSYHALPRCYALLSYHVLPRYHALLRYHACSYFRISPSKGMTPVHLLELATDVGEVMMVNRAKLMLLQQDPISKLHFNCYKTRNIK